MRKRGAVRIVLAALLLVVGCDSSRDIDAVRWISMADLVQSLDGMPPMTVGFDVDDTVLFSSPGFHYGQMVFSPGSEDFLRMPEFWERMNTELDSFSLPKAVAAELLRIHESRGDSIVFITARFPSERENLSPLLTDFFDLTTPAHVIFTGFEDGQNLKVAPMRRLRVQLFYGDSDGDIEAALITGARAVRIMRAPNTTYQPLPDYGRHGEEVLRNSMF